MPSRCSSAHGAVAAHFRPTLPPRLAPPLSFAARSWISIYPCYINAVRKLEEGRRLPKAQCCPNPHIQQMAMVCRMMEPKLQAIMEVAPMHPRDFFSRGRLRVKLKNDDGTFANPAFTSKKAVMQHLAQHAMKIRLQRPPTPKTKAMVKAEKAAAGGGAGGGKKGKKKKGKKGRR